jgi:hypothetical protein
LHVLVGGWSWVAAAVAWLSCGRHRPPLRSMGPAIAAGMLLALPGLAAGLMLNHGADPVTIRDANMIYVYRRLMHHLVFHRFPHLFMARHALLLALWLTVCWLTPCRITSCQLGQRPLRGFVAGTILLSIAGILIDQSLLYRLDLAAALLKYYWYRLADVFLAVGAALALGHLVDRWWIERPRAAPWLLIALMLIAGTWLGATNLQRRGDLRPGADLQMLPSWPGDAARTQRKYEDWRRVCDWIAANTPADAVFITPRNQQSFKWYTGRAEVFSWKDVPQDPRSVVVWWQRQRQLYPRSVVRGGLSVLGETRLVELAREYGARYIVLDRDYSQRSLLLPQVYPGPTFENCSYEVYRVPEEVEAAP